MNHSSQPLAWLKPAVLTGGLAPLGTILLLWGLGMLSADPVAEVLNQFGFLAFILLLASLACKPLKLCFGWTWPLRIRKMLGLLAFFYALLHFSTYVWIDQGLHWEAIWEDLARRKFILVGFCAFVLLIPLAVTSTQKMVRRLGAKRWQRLHKLAYVAALLATVHFLWRVKIDRTEPLWYGSVLLALLGIRIFYYFLTPRGHLFRD